MGLLFSPHVWDPHRSVIHNLLIYGTTGQLFFLTGLWATLQYKWLHVQHTPFVMVCERVLFALSPVVSAVLQCWGIATATGAANAPFHLMCLLSVYYYLFAIPLTPSCRPRDKATTVGGKASAMYVQGPEEAATQAALFLFSPVLMYVTLHRPTLFEHMHHLWSLLLLASLPALFICFCSKKNALWWTNMSEEAVQATVWGVAACALVAAVAGLEGRVVFFAFQRFILVPQPWSWILVSVALYGVALLIAGHLLGSLRGEIGQPVAMTVMVTSAMATALAAGAPMWLMPAPFFAAVGLASFYSTRELRDYLFFVAGATISFAWFLTQHFWFLEIQLGSLSLRELCRYLLLELGLALAVPGLLGVGAPVVISTVVLATHGALLGVMEEQLYGGAHDEDDGLYPAYLIVATSLIGEVLVYQLHCRKLLHPIGTWILRCLYGAKLMILLVPGTYVLPSAFVVALATTAVFVIPTKEEAGPGATRLSSGAGLALVAGAFAALLAARYTLFDLIVLVTDHRPSESLVLGTVFVVTAFVAMALAERHYPNMPDPKRGVLMLMCVGLLLLLLRPPLPRALDAMWDTAHVPEDERDDVEVYGARPTAKAAWPAWTLLVTCLLGVLATTSASPAQSPAMQALYAVLSGAGAGVYISYEYFDGHRLLRIVVLSVTISTSLMVVFLQRPSASSPSWMPFVFAFLVAILPAALLAHHVDTTPSKGRLPQEEEAIVEEMRNTLIAFFTCVYALLAFSIKLKVSSLLLGGSTRSHKRGGVRRMHTPAHGGARPGHLKALGASLWAKQMSEFGLAWLPAVGNIAVILCFALSLVLNVGITGGADVSIFAIAPLLLLLNQDMYIFKGMGDKQRYFPLTAAVAVYLTLSRCLHAIMCFIRCKSLESGGLNSIP